MIIINGAPTLSVAPAYAGTTEYIMVMYPGTYGRDVTSFRGIADYDCWKMYPKGYALSILYRMGNARN